MHLTREEVEEIERRIDEGFLKCSGRTWRENAPPPVDSLADIIKDFPSLFSKGDNTQ